jgi:hypothetical protein
MKNNNTDVVGLVNVYVIVPLLFLIGSIILLEKAKKPVDSHILES